MVLLNAELATGHNVNSLPTLCIPIMTALYRIKYVHLNAINNRPGMQRGRPTIFGHICGFIDCSSLLCIVRGLCLPVVM